VVATSILFEFTKEEEFDLLFPPSMVKFSKLYSMLQDALEVQYLDKPLDPDFEIPVPGWIQHK